MKPGVTPEMEARVNKKRNDRFLELLYELFNYKRFWVFSWAVALLFILFVLL
jgi:hypothetical protein